MVCILLPIPTPRAVVNLVISPAFLSSLLKDIKSERPKITEKDHIRLLFLVKWFLEFFLAVRANAKAEPKESNATVWGFDLVGEIVERSWIVWILKRMREAVEEKVTRIVWMYVGALY